VPGAEEKGIIMNGLVVAPEPQAVQAGMEVLAKGGNAVDAAIAAAFVQGVVNPLLCGIGGSGLLFLHHGPTDETLLIDCSCTLGSNLPPADWPGRCVGRSEAYGRYILDNEDNQMGYRSIATPGVVKGAGEAYRRFGSGRLSWTELLAPARQLAQEGFVIDKSLARQLRSTGGSPGYPSWQRKLAGQPTTAALLGLPRQAGERLVQEDCGRTLQRLAENGADEFYSGRIGEEMARDMEMHSALITGKDLQQYEAPTAAPVCGRYRGYEVRAAVSGSSSSPQVLSMLQILEGFAPAAMEHNSPDYIDLLSRVMRAGFADHVPLKCDPPFSVALHLLAKYTSPRRAAYWQERIATDMNIGLLGPAGHSPGTTHVSVIDGAGSAVSWTHTIGSLGGSGVITPGLGFLYNNFVGHFNPRPGYWDSIVAGKRGGGGAPLLLFKNGRLFMAIGAPGGSRIFTAVLQAIVNVIDHGMSMEEAVAAPRFHSEEDGLIFVEPAIPESTVRELQARGYRVRRSTYMARVQAIMVEQETGRLLAGADPRSS